MDLYSDNNMRSLGFRYVPETGKRAKKGGDDNIKLFMNTWGSVQNVDGVWK